MKNVLITSVLLLTLTAGFTSCKKDWACSCTDQSGNTTSTTISNQTLLDARAKCKGMDFNYTVGNATVSESCGLQ